MNKICLNCNKIFEKHYHTSRKVWKLQRYCSSRCFGLHANTAQKLKGRKRPLDVVEKCLKTTFKKGGIPWNKGIPHTKIQGENHHNWKGGITDENRRIRTSLEMKLWRRAVFERDNYTCQGCRVRGGKLHADHIKPFALFPEFRFAIDNGRTLCKECHMKTPTWGFNTLYYSKVNF